MQQHSGTARTVSCPTCGAPVAWTPQARWRPFCSERCRLIDLGSWLDESNRISAEETAPETAATGAEDHHRQL